MKTIRKSIFLFLITCTLLFLGYYRDFVFKSVNALIKAMDFNMDYSMPSSLKFLEHYEYNSLLNIKWLLTLLFSIFYLITAIITIKLLFKNKRYIYITIAAYIIVTIISGLFITIGVIFDNTAAKMYEFARYLMGMAQSPLILMILIPAFKLYSYEIRNRETGNIDNNPKTY